MALSADAALSSWLAPPLLPAVLVMVLFALIPRRRQLVLLAAVLGWAAVWLDSRLTVEPFDMTGLAVVAVAVAVGVLLRGLWDEVAPPEESDDAEHSE